MGQMVFELEKRKSQTILNFSSFLLLKISKKTFPVGAGSKNLNIFVVVVATVGYQSTFSAALRQAKKQHFIVKFWN